MLNRKDVDSECSDRMHCLHREGLKDVVFTSPFLSTHVSCYSHCHIFP